MTKSSIPLVRLSLSDDDIASAVEVLKSGKLISGKTVETFERQLATYLKVRYAVCVSSGTAALHLGLLAMGIRAGDEVIVPAFSYPASANSVELTGAKVVFVDSEFGGFNIDTGAIENKITSRTRAIMVVHNFGWPMDINKIQSIAARHDLPIIEDAACALGSSVGGSRCGNFGRLAGFSFHPRKILTTGEGGVVVTDDSRISERIKELRNHGQQYNPGPDFRAPGFNYRMTEFQAALGVSQMKRFNAVLRARITAGKYYNENLGDSRIISPPEPQGTCKVNYQTYIGSVSDGHRDSLIKYLGENGIEAGIGTYSIPHTSYYAEKYKIDETQYPQSLKAYRNLISLPLYEGITEKEQDKVIAVIKNYLTIAIPKLDEKVTVSREFKG